MFIVKRAGVVVSLIGAFWGVPVAHAQMTLTALGGLSGNLSGNELNYRSAGGAISGDGKVIGGASIDQDGRVDAFRWTKAGGMEAIGNLGNGNKTSVVGDLSYDGTTIVGMSPWANGDDQITEAYRWTSSGMQGLGRQIGADPPNFAPYLAPFSASTGVSDDGSVVVGASSSKNGPVEAFLWTTTTSKMEGLGDLPGGDFYSVGRSVSGGGTIVVGESRSGKDGNEAHTEAFRWTQSTGMEGLGNLGGVNFDSVAYDVSQDGKVIVGRAESATGTEAFRWTQADGMIGLDTGHLFSVSSATAVSGDGSIVVGFANIPLGGQPDSNATGVVWTKSQGLRKLVDILTEGGINISDAGWEYLSDIEDISADGTTISGNGMRKEGYREVFTVYDPNRFGLGALASAPEPGSLALLGVAALPLVGLVRRRKA